MIGRAERFAHAPWPERCGTSDQIRIIPVRDLKPLWDGSRVSAEPHYPRTGYLSGSMASCSGRPAIGQSGRRLMALSQVQIIKSLGEALSWFEKELAWQVEAAELR